MRGHATSNNLRAQVQAMRAQVRAQADPNSAKVLQRFFKTAPGEYGYGDVFLGVRVPALRRIARECRAPSAELAIELLRSPIHEDRLLALLILIRAFETTGTRGRARISALYLKNSRFVNNWDLVDLSAPTLAGEILSGPHGRTILARLTRSPTMWRRRIAMVSTLWSIRRGMFEPALRTARALLRDPEDLLHKAAGWMLREVGKRDRAALKSFLDAYACHMPRTMLRYAIERLPDPLRQAYLARKPRLQHRLPRAARLITARRLEARS